MKKTYDECLQAVQIAVNYFEANSLELDKYKIIEVKNMLFNPDGKKTSQKWVLTFKKRELLENKSGIIGKGGEVFIEADLSNSKCKLISYGE